MEPRRIINLQSNTVEDAKYEALIRDCGNDEKVPSEIRENLQTLQAQGYTFILGLRDLYPNTDLNRMQRGLSVTERLASRLVPTQIVIAVQEVEAWFLKECQHYTCIDASLSVDFINNRLGFDPCSGNVRLRSHPSEDLKDIYRLVGKSYTKKKAQVERTVNCLDYTNLYMDIRNEIAELETFIICIDNFLS